MFNINYDSIIDICLGRIRLNNPNRNGLLPMGIIKILKSFHGVNWKLLLNDCGLNVYDNRFESFLFYLISNYYNNQKNDGEKIHPYNDIFLEELIEDKELFNKIYLRWQKDRDLFGILSPFWPIENNSDIRTQILQYVNKGGGVDVYSKLNRYPNLYVNIEKQIQNRTTIVDLGCAAGEILNDLSVLYGNSIGVDILSLEETLKDEKLRSIWDRSHEMNQLAYISYIKSKNIVFHKGSMFDSSLVGSLIKVNPQSTTIMLMNSIYPHFDSKSFIKLIRMISEFTPQYIVIGGKNPSIENYLYEKNKYTVENISWIFELRDGKYNLIAEALD